METKTVQGLFVFLGLGLEITISSNMDPTSSRGEPKTSGDVFATAGFVAGLRVRCLLRRLSAPMIQATTSGAAIPKLEYVPTTILPPGQRRKHEAPGRPSGTDEHGKECQTAGQDRSRKSLIDGLVDHVSERFLAQQTIVLTDAIEDDDRVVHGITTKVSSAAITVREISKCSNEKSPRVIRTS